MIKRRHLSATARDRLFKERGGICHLCQGEIQIGQRWEIEHVIPLGLGGDDDESNMMLAHAKCHSLKTTKTDVPNIARAERRRRRHFGIKRRTSFRGWRRFGGQIVWAGRER